jgi:hypothetical protein
VKLINWLVRPATEGKESEEETAEPTTTAETVEPWPHVRITNKSLPGWGSKIELNGQDISQWCFEYRVRSAVKDVTVLELKLFCGSLELDVPAETGPLALNAEIESLLIKQGWSPPGWSAADTDIECGMAGETSDQ